MARQRDQSPFKFNLFSVSNNTIALSRFLPPKRYKKAENKGLQHLGRTERLMNPPCGLRRGQHCAVTMSLPILLPPRAIPKAHALSHLEWTPKRYLEEPQPPSNEDALLQEEFIQKQLLEGKVVKKTRPRRTVDYNGGMGRWILVSRNNLDMCTAENEKSPENFGRTQLSFLIFARVLLISLT